MVMRKYWFRMMQRINVFNWSMMRSNRAMESFGAMHKWVWSMVKRISTMVESFLAMMERVSWMVRGKAEAIVGQSQVMRCLRTDDH